MTLPPFDRPMPPSGVTIDQEVVADLQASVARPRVAVRMQGATILLSRALLEAMSARAEEIPLRVEDDRLRNERARGRRARDLLRNAAGPGPDGDFAVSALSREQGYVMHDLLRHGYAQVLLDGDAEPSPRVRVRYWGNKLGPTMGFGNIDVFAEAPAARVSAFSLPFPSPPGGGGVSLLHLSWWSS